MATGNPLRIASRQIPGILEKLLALFLCSLVADAGCGPVGPLDPTSGIRDYQDPAFVRVPGGMVNVTGGNFLTIREDLSIQSAVHGNPETIEATYNSASGEWVFNFQMTYDGSTFVDHRGTVIDASGIPDQSPIPGTYWFKWNESEIMAKGGLVYSFDTSTGRLIEKYTYG
jgi:hypothetical protein